MVGTSHQWKTVLLNCYKKTDVYDLLSYTMNGRKGLYIHIFIVYNFKAEAELIKFSVYIP